MRFASLQGGNTSDYAAAGKAVANSAAKTFAVQRKSGPDYGMLSQVAMKTNAQEKIAAIKASAKVTKAGIDAYSDVTRTGHKVAAFNNQQDIKASQRKAGGLAAIGKIAGAGFLAAKDNTKDRAYPTADRTAIDSAYKAKRNELLSSTEKSRAALNGESDSANTVDNKSKADTAGTLSTVKPIAGMSDGWSRWSKLIKAGEGTSGQNGYNTMFTGAQFSDTSKHPRQINRSGELSSDAAGAYQFLSTTWDGAKKSLGLTDFSPASQEKAGKYLAQKRGLATDTVFTNKQSFLKELDKISPEWASMPTAATGTSYYGQGGLSPDEAWKIYSGN